jgi:hypothetical protein
MKRAKQRPSPSLSELYQQMPRRRGYLTQKQNMRRDFLLQIEAWHHALMPTPPLLQAKLRPFHRSDR